MSRFTLLVTAAAFRESAETAEAPIREAGGEIRYPPRMGPLPAAELIPALRDADAVVAAMDPYTGPVLDACPRLRAVVRWGTGWDAVDLAACTERGVLACNAPGLNVQAVADYVFGALLALARRLPHQMALMRAGGWEEVRGVELWSRTLGIVGFGAIGRAVARRAGGFDCRLLVHDPWVPAETIAAHGGEAVDLDGLLAESDFVTLHASLTAESRHLIGAAQLARMKPGAFLVNAARGAMVDEDALARALAAGRLAGAAVDCFAAEPLAPDHPLRHLPNCLATPHSAFNTVEAAAATNRVVAEQVLAILRGDRPEFPLNPEVLQLPGYRGRTPLLQGENRAGGLSRPAP